MIETAKLIIKQGLSVREIEKMAKAKKAEPKIPKKKKRDTIYDEVELALGKNTGRKIKVKENTKSVEIEFFDKDDLSSLAKLLGEK